MIYKVYLKGEWIADADWFRITDSNCLYAYMVAHTEKMKAKNVQTFDTPVAVFNSDNWSEVILSGE